MKRLYERAHGRRRQCVEKILLCHLPYTRILSPLVGDRRVQKQVCRHQRYHGGIPEGQHARLRDRESHRNSNTYPSSSQQKEIQSVYHARKQKERDVSSASKCNVWMP